MSCLRGKDGSGRLYKLSENSLLPYKCLMNAQVSSLNHLGAGLRVRALASAIWCICYISHAQCWVLKSLSCPHQCSKLELLELSFCDQALVGS